MGKHLLLFFYCHRKRKGASPGFVVYLFNVDSHTPAASILLHDGQIGRRIGNVDLFEFMHPVVHLVSRWSQRNYELD